MVFGMSIRELLLSVLLGLFGGMLLKAFYSMVRMKMPTSYVYGASHLQRSAKSSIIRYLIFRFAPVYFVCLAVCVTAERLELYVLPAFISTVLLFVALSSFVSIFCRLKMPTKGAGFHTFLQLGGVVGTILIGYLGYLSHDSLSFLVPEPSEFVIAVWTAVFVAVVAHLLAKATSGVSERLDIERRIEMVVNDIGEDNWAWIKSECRRHDVPWCVIAAIVMVEVSERPKWMRSVERICGRLLCQKVVMSYGITQERSNVVLTDRESVRLTICWIGERLSSGAKNSLSEKRHSCDVEEIKSIFSRQEKAISEVKDLADCRNPDGCYGEMVADFANGLFNRYV